MYYSLSSSLTVVRDLWGVFYAEINFSFSHSQIQFRILRDESINTSKERLMLELFGSFGLLGHSQGSLRRKNSFCYVRVSFIFSVSVFFFRIELFYRL